MGKFVKGIRTGLFVSEPAPSGQAATLPAIPFRVRAYTPEGSTRMFTRRFDGPDTTLPAGAILRIGTTNLYILVTETELIGGGRFLSVAGADGTGGVPISLDPGAHLTWDGLMRIAGTSNSDLRVSEATQENTSVVYDISSGPLPWSEAEVTSKNWTLDRRGNFKPRDLAYQAVELASLEGREVYVRRILPDENGDPIKAQEGRAFVLNLTNPAPADGIITASWEFRGQGKLDVQPYPPPPLSPGIMMDFEEKANAINFMFM